MCDACTSTAEILTRHGQSRRALLAGGVAAATAPAIIPASARAQEASASLAASDVQAWAATDTSLTFTPFTINRRAAGPKDVVIDIMYSSIPISTASTATGVR